MKEGLGTPGFGLSIYLDVPFRMEKCATWEKFSMIAYPRLLAVSRMERPLTPMDVGEISGALIAVFWLC